MEPLRHHRTAGPDRFLDLFTHPDAAAPPSIGVELHEDEVLWTRPGSPEPEPLHSPKPATPSPRAAAIRCFPERASGILVALKEDDKGLGGAATPFLWRWSVVPPSSTSPSSSSSAEMMIPAITKAEKPEGPYSMPAGQLYHQSASVSVPMPAARQPRLPSGEMNRVEDDEGREEEKLPPHEIVARSPMTTFSVLEGAGRTLKGRDLRRVRNAVWRKTGFLD